MPKIKVIGVPNAYPFLTHSINGQNFLFTWDAKECAYVYEAKSRHEAEAIFTTPRVLCPWTFCPVVTDAPTQEQVIESASDLERAKAEIEELRSRIAELEAKPKRTKKAPSAETIEDV
jgi:hypothetical protein